MSGREETAGRQAFDLQLSAVPAVMTATGRGERVVGLAADDEDPELGFIGVLGLEYVVRAARSTK